MVGLAGAIENGKFILEGWEKWFRYYVLLIHERLETGNNNSLARTLLPVKKNHTHSYGTC